MSISRANINWTGVSFTPISPGTLIPLTRITAGMFGQGGQAISFKGDTDQYPTIIATPTTEPHASFTSADVATFFGIHAGTTGTLAAQLNDAKGVTGGGVLFAGLNAVFVNADGSAPHAQFATVTGTFQLFSSDGVTNPLSFTLV